MNTAALEQRPDVRDDRALASAIDAGDEHGLRGGAGMLSLLWLRPR
jgi:hypothetical protein